MKPSTADRIGIDLGGTKIEAIRIDAADDVRRRIRIDAPSGSYQRTLEAIQAITADISEGNASTPVGVGMPGSLSLSTGLVKNANSTWLIGKPFDKDLRAALGRKVRVANDADCFALSEASDGAAAQYATVFGVILGTGVGGGLVANGKLLSGPNAIAGEWGHNPLPWLNERNDPAMPCYCGKTGCIETFLSGPGLARHHAAATGRTWNPADIVLSAISDDPDCVGSMDAYHDRLARALAHVINIFDPHAIVLGGGLSQVESLFDEVPKLWGQYVFSDSVLTPLLRPMHGDASGVRGAAWLWSLEEAAEITK